MEKNNCTLTGHTYDIWELYDESHVSRKCLDCNYEEILPSGIDTLKQIKLQQEALPLLNSFLNISINDEAIIGYINVIINDCLPFINQDNKFKLMKKLNEVTHSSSLSEENKLLLNNLITSIKERNNDLQYDTIDYFEKYNQEALSSVIISSKTNLTK